MEENNKCNHKYVHLDTIKKVNNNEHSYTSQYIRIDRFFCEKCLNQKEVIKKEYHNETPEWF